MNLSKVIKVPGFVQLDVLWTLQQEAIKSVGEGSTVGEKWLDTHEKATVKPIILYEIKKIKQAK